VRIDPSGVEAIQALSLTRSKKQIQSFLGKINFLRRFVSNFSELVKHVTTILRMGNEVKWTNEPRESFEQIKRALTKAPVLINSNYSKDFLIFSFASFDTVVVVLLQKNSTGLDQPISFFSKSLRDTKIRYDIMETKSLCLGESTQSFQSLCLALKVNFICSFSLCKGNSYTTGHRW